ncbi:hypothetical protein Tco_1316169 [Tanacetum coccineum]
MVRPKQSWHFRSDDIMDYDPYTVYVGFPNIFSMNVHHGGKFTSRLNKKYVSGKVKFVNMIDSKELTIEVLHKIVKMLKYPAKQRLFYQFKIPNKTLDWGLRALDKDDDIINLIKYVSEHKVIEVYIEHHESLVESLDGDNDNDWDDDMGSKGDNKEGIEGDNQQGIEGDNEMGSEGDNDMGNDEGSDGDNEIDNDMGSDEIGSYHSIEMVADQGDDMGSEHGGAEEEFSDHDDDNIVDEEHIIDELEVNMEGFRFSIDDDLVVDTFHPEVNVTENDLEVIYFDSFDSDIGDDSDSERRAALRKLKKEGKQNSSQSRIANYFFVGQEFLNKEEAKKRIKSDPVESSNANQGYTRSNAKTVTVKLDCYREEDPESTTRLFRRIYVCLGPLKEGFKAGSRELLGLDGAFMKGQYPDFCCSKKGLEDKILVPKPPRNCARCARCGTPVDGPYCQGCALLRKKFKEDLFTYCVENEFFEDLQDTSESSDDNTNVVNAPQEPFVGNQDPGENSSPSPPHIDHCCHECGDSLDGIFCRRCTCKSCRKGAHYSYNCPPKALIISNLEPCKNQTIDIINSKRDNPSSGVNSTYGEDIDYVDASSLDVEIVSLEVVEIVDPEVERLIRMNQYFSLRLCCMGSFLLFLRHLLSIHIFFSLDEDTILIQHSNVSFFYAGVSHRNGNFHEIMLPNRLNESPIDDFTFLLLPHGPMNTGNRVKACDLKHALRGGHPLLIVDCPDCEGTLLWNKRPKRKPKAQQNQARNGKNKVKEIAFKFILLQGDHSAYFPKSLSFRLTYPAQLPQKKQSRRKQRKETEVPQDETHHDDSVPIPSNDPLFCGEDRIQLTKLMILYTNLQKQVLDLEKAKDAQAKEIAGLKKRVQKLEMKKKSRTTGLKRLRKVGESSRVESSEDKENNLHGDEVIVDMEVGEKQEKSAKIDEREVSTGVEDSVAPTIPVTTTDEGSNLLLMKKWQEILEAHLQAELIEMRRWQGKRKRSQHSFDCIWELHKLTDGGWIDL